MQPLPDDREVLFKAKIRIYLVAADPEFTYIDGAGRCVDLLACLHHKFRRWSLAYPEVSC